MTTVQAFPGAAGALGDVGLFGALVMHLEVLVGAVAKELRAARPEVGEPGDELLGRRRGRLVEVDRGHACSSRGGVRRKLALLARMLSCDALVHQTLVSVMASRYQSMRSRRRLLSQVRAKWRAGRRMVGAAVDDR